MKIVEKFVEGIRKHDPNAEVEIIQLAGQILHECTGCFSCWLTTKGVCRLNGKEGDKFGEYAEKYMKADRLIISSPLHFYNCTSLLMKFIERTLSLTVPVPMQERKLDSDDKGEFSETYGNMWTKDVAVISTALKFQSKNESSYEVFDLLFSKLTWNKCQKIKLPQPANRSKEYKAIWRNIWENIEIFGAEFAENGAFSEGSKNSFNDSLERLLSLKRG